MTNIWRRARRFVGALVGFVALIIGGSRCSDLTAPSQLGNVVIQFSQPQDTITAVVGDTIAPVFNVMIGAQRQERARYVYSVITANDRLRVIRNGEAIEVLDRGVDTIYARVVGVTIGGPSNSAKLVDTIYVIAGAADNRVSSPAGAFRSLGEFRDLNATSVSRQGVPVRGGQVTWESTNSTVVSVVNVQSVGDTSRARVRANSNGTAEILTIFENIDTVRTPVTVEQQFAKFRLVSSRNSGLTSIRFRSLTDTSYVHAFPQDSLGNNFVAGANVASVPTASFALSQSGVISLAVIDANTALMTSETNGIIRLVANGAGTLASDSMQVTVAQEAVSLVIDGLRVDTIPSIGATREFTATALDALGRGLPPDSIVWASTMPGVASISGKNPAVARGNTVGTTSIAASRDSHSDTVTLVVRNDPDRVVLSPDTLRILSVNDTVSFTPAVVTNTRGDPLTGIPVTYHSLDSTIAQPLSDGAIWGRRVGVTRVFATTGGSNPKVDTSRVVVTNAPASIDIVPSSYTFTNPNESADSLAVPARLFNSRGVALPRAAANWRSGNEAVARVTSDSSKTIISTGIGDTYIYAYSPIDSLNVRDSILVTFTAGAAAGYRVTASNSAPVAGSSVTIRAQLVDANNNPVRTAGNAVSFTSTNGGSFTGSNPATTDATGAAVITFNTATTVSSHTVTATTGGLAGSSTPITSVAAAANNYLVTPSTINPAAGATITLAAQLRDANGNAVATPGQVVTWTKSDANGAFSGGGSSTTNASGIATIQLTTHTVAGTATTVTATTGSLNGTSPAITTVAGAASQLTLTQAPSATAQSGIPFGTQPVLQLRDGNGNPVSQANVSVTATITAGGGSLGGATLVQTNGLGAATFSDLSISGTNGGRTLTFTASGVSGATAGVTLGSGTATQMSMFDGNGQTQLAGSELTTDPAVRVVDGSGNAVAGVNVTFTVTAGGGTISPPSGSTVATDASGVARLTSWTLGTAAGTNTISATAAGLIGSPVTFSATGLVGVVNPGTSSVLRTGGNNVTANGSAASEITVTLRDQHGNPVPGKTVSLARTGTTSVISAPSGTTSNALGEVRFVVTNITIETVTYTATANDPGAITLTQTAQVTFVAGSPFMIASTGTSQNAVIGTNVAAPPAILVRDGSSNPLQGVSVTFTLTASGGGGGLINGSAGPVTVVTDAAGVAALTSWTVGQTAGTNNNSVTATAPGVLGSPVTFTASGDNPDPDLTTVAPSTGVLGETKSLVLTGTGFISGSTVSFNSPSTGITINSVVLNSSTQLTVNVTIASGASLGTRNVRVTNPGPGGGSSSDRLFSVSAPAAPTLTNLSPANGSRSETLNVVFTGTGFANGVTSVNVPAGFTLNSVVVNSSTQLTANISIAVAAALGAHNFSVTNTPAGGTSATQTFTVTNPAPTLTALAPTSGERRQTLDVVFTGTGFISGVSTVSVGPNITVNSTTVNSTTQLTANVTIADIASTGARDFSVTNAGPGGGTSAVQSFTVTNPAPTLSAIAPTSGLQGQTAMSVVLTGTSFVPGSVVTFTPSAGITINSTTVDSPTQITLSITIDDLAATGARDVTVTNAAPGGGTTGAQVFTINAPPAPTLTSIAPAVGDRLQTLNVVFTGTNFVNGVTTVDAPAGITVNSVIVNSATQLTANLTIASTTTLGANSFTVTNTPAGGTSGAQTFTVSNPAPTVTLVSPNPVDGDILATTTVASTTITGTGFINGVTVVDFVSGATINGTVTVNNSTSITVTNIQYPAAGVLGTSVQLRVTNPGRAPVLHTITVNP